MDRFFKSTALTQGTLASHLTGYLPRIGEIEMDVSKLKIDTVVFDCTDSRSTPWVIIPAAHGMMKNYSIPGGFIRINGMSDNDPVQKGLEILSGVGSVRQIVLMSHGGCPETAPCAATKQLMAERIAEQKRSYYTGLFENDEERALGRAFRRRNAEFDSGPSNQDAFDLAAISLMASARNLLRWPYAGGRVEDAVKSGELDIIPVYEQFDQATQSVKIHVYNQNPTKPEFVEVDRQGSFVERLMNEQIKGSTSRSGFIEGAASSSIRRFTRMISQGQSIVER